jgi:Rrf2 family protein
VPDAAETAAISQLIRRDRALLAITLVLDVAFHAGRAGTVSAIDIATRLGSARRGLEPVLQALTRAGLLESVRGPRGGYRLGRPPRALRLAEIITATAIEPEPTDGPGGQLLHKVIDPLWAELAAPLATQLGSMTLEDLLRRAAAAGLHRPAAEPLDWVI